MVTISFMENGSFNFLCAIMLIKHNIGFTVMEYAIYLTLYALGFGLVFYGIRKIVKRRNRLNLVASSLDTTSPTTDDTVDDFICIRRADGSTVASSGGVTVVGRRK